MLYFDIDSEPVVAHTKEALAEIQNTSVQLDMLEGVIPATIRSIMEITQGEAAKDNGISRTTMSRFERGEYKGDESLADRVYDYYAGKSRVWGASSDIAKMLIDQRKYVEGAIVFAQDCMVKVELGLIGLNSRFEHRQEIVSDSQREAVYKFIQRLKRFATRLEKLTNVLDDPSAIGETANFILHTRVESPDYYATTGAINVCGDFWANDEGELIHFRGSESIVFNPAMPVLNAFSSHGAIN